MTSVNRWVVADEQHAAMYLGVLLNQVRLTFAAEDWKGLRQSHFRVLFSVPAEGVSITELAERVGMTKQGCGQFVSQLTDEGYLTQAADPRDRRARVVRRTAAGRRMVIRVTARNLQIEQQWADEVGADRYAVFRSVLHQLASLE